MKVNLCRDCRHSMPEPGSEWNLRCMNVEVNKRDPWALAESKPYGSTARDERGRRWFAPCGMKGKLWESKPIGGVNTPSNEEVDVIGKAAGIVIINGNQVAAK